MLADKRTELISWLQHLPKSVSVTGIIASRHEEPIQLARAEFIQRLQSLQLEAGSEDASALAAARHLTAKQKSAAILWIHGPQSLVFKDELSDINELMDRGNKVKILDLQVGEAQTNEIANYMSALDYQASPLLIDVASSNSFAGDLANVEKNQLAGGTDYAVRRSKVTNPVHKSVIDSFPMANRVSTIWAADEARRAANLGAVDVAVTLGTAYRVVTPVTGAVVMEQQSDYDYQQLHRNFYEVVDAKTRAPQGTADGTSTLAQQEEPGVVLGFGDTYSVAAQDAAAASPMLQGATMGTITPPPAPKASPMFARAMHAALKPAPTSTPAPFAAAAPVMDLRTASMPGQSGAADSSLGFTAPALQGATNGTIGPQGADANWVPSAPMGARPQITNWFNNAARDANLYSDQGPDATYVTGVNTAGSVRVNSRANLEALLTVIANGIAIVGLVWGLPTLVLAITAQNAMSSANKVMFGSLIIILGCAVPNLMSLWFASDAFRSLF
jgi:hypothetical protein